MKKAQLGWAFFILSYPHAFLRDYNLTYFCLTSWNVPSFGFQQVIPKPT
jgi:hypothetical protein